MPGISGASGSVMGLLHAVIKTGAGGVLARVCLGDLLQVRGVRRGRAMGASSKCTPSSTIRPVSPARASARTARIEVMDVDAPQPRCGLQPSSHLEQPARHWHAVARGRARAQVGLTD